MKKSISPIAVIRKTALMYYARAPFAIIAAMVCAIASGAVWALAAPINEMLFAAVDALVAGDGSPRAVYVGVALAVGLVFVILLVGTPRTYLGAYIADRMQVGLKRVQLQKISRLPAETFEDSTALDLIEKSEGGVQGIYPFFSALENIVFYYGAFFFVMGAYLWSVQPVLLLALVFIFVPVAVSQVVKARLHAGLVDTTAPQKRREQQYTAHALNTRETRLFGGFFYFYALVRQMREAIFKAERDVQRKVQLIELCLNLLKLAGWLGVCFMLLRGLAANEISVAAFAAVFVATGEMFVFFEHFFGAVQAHITNELGGIHKFLCLLDLPENSGADTPPDFSAGVQLHNVTFAYPNADKPAVDDVSITIAPQEIIAIVGENGSGKTTLIKLLCGLYKPTRGSVIIGGVDSAQVSNAALFSEMSAVFQEPARYGALSLSQNVNISDFGKPADDVAPALARADVDYSDTEAFPQGPSTIMAREYGGTELSGGQWQRVGMARGIFRDHTMIILDEPTAAIDPLEEARVYKQFAEHARGKIAVLVTHRLGSARIADRILVMQNGRIVESGSHEQLQRSGGVYAQMWRVQAGGYA